MANQDAAIAIDWGGTWNRTALVDRQGRFLWQTREPNPHGGDREAFLELGSRQVRAALAEAGGAVAGIGVAVAGPVEPTSGILHRPPNLMALNGVSLKAIWREEFSCPVWVGNDADLAAFGEYHFGAGKDSAEQGRPVKTLFYITVSTGIGGGLVDRDLVYLGSNGLAIEVGHTTVDIGDAAPWCACGNQGCLEALASGSGIARNARDLLSDGHYAGSTLATATTVDSQAVFAAASQGDPLGRTVLDNAIHALIVGLTNAVHLFNPDLIVFGGGVTDGLVEYGLLPRIHQGIQERTMSELHREFQLTASRLGDSAGMAGAAALVWSHRDADAR